MAKFMVDFGDNINELLDKLLQKEKPIIVYLPSLDESGLEIIRYCYVNQMTPEVDFDYIINENNVVLQVRVKHITFWSFEVTMRTKWKEWNITTTEKFNEIVEQMRGEGFTSMTASASAFTLWRYGDKKKGIESQHYTYEKHFPVIEDTEMLEYIDGSYKGGLIKASDKYLGKDTKVVSSYWDVNSMYPSKMLDYYPVGVPAWFDNAIDAANNGYDLVLYKVHIRSARIWDGAEPFIGVRKDKISYEYPPVLKNVILYLWRPEYQRFTKMYEVIEYTQHKVLAFKKWSGNFSSYVNYWKAKKDEYKQQGDKVRTYAAKIMLNALYGKFGTKDAYKNVEYNIDMERIYTQEQNSSKYYRAFASYITMAARVELQDIIQLNYKRFIYCDTDSILLTGTNAPITADIDPLLMGSWKHEGNFTRIAIRAPKFLIKTDDKGMIHRTMAGTTEENARTISYENIFTL